LAGTIRALATTTQAPGQLRTRSAFVFSQAEFQSHRSQFEINYHSVSLLKMIANELTKDMAFSDLERMLQQTTSDNSTNSPESEKFNVTGALLFVVLMLVLTIFGILRMRDLPGDEAVHKTAKSTLAERKRAILELFKTSEVTMVSHDQTGIAKGIRISNSRET
jgi:hypothetical protein